MDNLHEAVKSDKCLIYSFGLADDWDFELSRNNFAIFEKDQITDIWIVTASST